MASSLRRTRSQSRSKVSRRKVYRRNGLLLELAALLLGIAFLQPTWFNQLRSLVAEGIGSLPDEPVASERVDPDHSPRLSFLQPSH